jgi:hypothetical protein
MPSPPSLYDVKTIYRDDFLVQQMKMNEEKFKKKV